jgi:hypothetical protein
MSSWWEIIIKFAWQPFWFYSLTRNSQKKATSFSEYPSPLVTGLHVLHIDSTINLYMKYPSWCNNHNIYQYLHTILQWFITSKWLQPRIWVIIGSKIFASNNWLQNSVLCVTVNIDRHYDSATALASENCCTESSVVITDGRILKCKEICWLLLACSSYVA